MLEPRPPLERASTRLARGARWGRRQGFFALTFVAVTSAACSAILGLEAPPDGAGSSGSSGTSGSSGADSGCPILYVSASGNDGNDGCTMANPKKSIKAALGVVETNGTAGYTIQVCAGVYPEVNLKVNLGGSLLGGYSCGTWTRTPDYRTDSVNETTVTVAAPDANNSTALVVGAPAADAGNQPLLVDGFTFQGPSGGALTRSTGVQFLSGSVAKILNCKIFGGDATLTSMGVEMTAPATPNIVGDMIKSGTAAQTYGVYASTSAGVTPYIHGNAITAGAVPAGATGTVGSYGVYLSGATDMTIAKGKPLENNTIIAGQGTPSDGVFMTHSNGIDILHNHIEAGQSGSLVSNSNALNAVAAFDGAGVHVLGNRLYSGGLPNGAGSFDGVIVVRSSDTIISNNMIYAGFRSATTRELGTATGVNLNACTSPIVENNTIFGGYAVGVIEISINTGTTGAVVRNNMFVGNGVNDSALRVDDCLTQLATLENNLFLSNEADTLRAACSNLNDGGGATATDLSAMKPALGTTVVTGNVMMRSPCSSADLDSGACLDTPACTKDGGLACIAEVFAPWALDNYGYSTLFSTGWTLADSVPCPVARGGVDLSNPPEGAAAAVTADLYGAPRQKMPSMGAAEGVRCE